MVPLFCASALEAVNNRKNRVPLKARKVIVVSPLERPVIRPSLLSFLRTVDF
jgi:hypothetical protein